MNRFTRAVKAGWSAAVSGWRPLVRTPTPVKYRATAFGPGLVGVFFYGTGALLGFVLFYTLNVQAIHLPVESLFLNRWTLGVLVPVVLLAIAGSAGRLAEKHSERRNQARRDRRASLILRQADEGAVGHYTLYLRSFASTGQMRVIDDRETSVMGLDARGPALVDLESALAEAVEEDAPLVALGRPGEHIGAGRVLTDDEHWQRDLDVLAVNAALLFVLPFASPGTEWEIDWILAHKRLDRSIFIMPPMTKKKRVIDWRDSWRCLKPMMAERGLSLPDYVDVGAFFVLDYDGGILAACPVPPVMKAGYVKMALKDLLTYVRL